MLKKPSMSTREPYENTEVNYRPSWDLDLEATRNQTQTPPNSVLREPVGDNAALTITRRRNKPTLSCTTCVNKKTKCDRVKPRCHACRNRNTPCVYHAPSKTSSRQETGLHGDPGELHSRRRSKSRTADLTLEDDGANANVLNHSTPSSGVTGFSFKDNSMTNVSSVSPDSNIQPDVRESADASSAPQVNQAIVVIGEDVLPTSMATPTLLSTLRSFEKEPSTAFNLFLMTSQHPFRNLWTDAGGLAEVIAVMPTEVEADWLVERYFQIVDPIYPVVCKDAFMIEYKAFWNTAEDQKHLFDAAHLALQLAMFATSATYSRVQSRGDRDTSAVFYLSCCYQCLCVSSYLNSYSLSTLQTMVLVTNYLVASHRPSDAWTFSGIAQRQAYGLKLHQDPTVVAPLASNWEQRTRCRVWLATMLQDVSLALYFELTPASMFYEIKHTSLYQFLDEHTSTSPATITDISYLKAIWQYAEFLQKQLCVNKALKQTYAKSPADKAQLITQYQTLQTNFDFPFNSTDPARFEASPERLARQLISLTSNYFFVLTLLCMDGQTSAGFQVDPHAVLQACHEGMSSFFALARLFPDEVDMWGALQIRAYAQATIIATILKKHGDALHKMPRDPHFMLAKSNLDRYVDILLRPSTRLEWDTIRQGRLADLQRLINQQANADTLVTT